MFFVKGLSLFFLIIEGKASSICNWYFISVSVCWRRILVRPNNKLKTVLVGIFVAAQVVIWNEDMLWFLVWFLMVDHSDWKFQWRYDRRGENSILSNCKLTRKNVGNSTVLEPMVFALALQCSTNWAMKIHTLLGAGQLIEFILIRTLGTRGFVSRAAGIFGVGRMKADISSALHCRPKLRAAKSRENTGGSLYKGLTETGNCH